MIKIDDILVNATVVHSDGIREQFEALRVIDKGVIIGRIIDGEFLGSLKTALFLLYVVMWFTI